MVAPKGRRIEGVVKLASGMLSNATVHGDVKISELPSQFECTLSPKLPINV